MAELNKIQQQVLDCIKEHNDPSGLGADYYYYMYCCSGKTDVQCQDAFDELLEELQAEGLLKVSGRDEEGHPLYSLSSEEKRVVSDERGQAFAALQYEFQGRSGSWLAETAKQAMMKFIPGCGMKNTNSVIQALILAASIGTEGKNPINPPERALVNATFGTVLSNSMDIIYNMMAQPLDEQAFGMMTVFCNVGGRETGLNLLRFILAFAYADGELSNEVAARLEAVFAPVLKEE